MLNKFVRKSKFLKLFLLFKRLEIREILIRNYVRIPKCFHPINYNIIQKFKVLQFEKKSKESDNNNKTELNGGNEEKDAFQLLNELKELAKNNAEFFRNDDTESGQRLFEAFRGLDTHIDGIEPLIVEIKQIAPQYDFDETVQANGYRSFLLVVHCAVVHSKQLCVRVFNKRDNMLFRKSLFVREVEACSHLMASLMQCLELLRILSKWSKPGDLFPAENHTPHDLLSTGDKINQYCFYGRALGFQFCESMRNVLKFIILSMTSFSEIYYKRGNLLSKATTSMWSSGKYLFDPELRARRVVNISQHASIDFCKAFWFLAESEIMQIVPKMAPRNVAVNKIISIPPESLEYTNCDGTVITIPAPSSHIGLKPIQVRLISSVPRKGMIGEGQPPNSHKSSPVSRGLLFHCHGGGFVAQSSRSHLVYLREWANQLNIPILSIDYSLAPEAPYPRAVEEILYAYVWALNNAHLLGTTAERIVFAGDSAGANLVTVLALKCIDLGIRQGDGIFLAYVPTSINFLPTPARMLCLMDPLLPLGFMLRCIKSYATVGSGKSARRKGSNTSSMESFEQVTESDLAALEAHKSLGTSDHMSDTLTNVSLSSQSPNRPGESDITTANGEWTKLDDETPKYDIDTIVTQMDIEEAIEANPNASPNDARIRNRMTDFIGVVQSTFNKWTDSIASGYSSDAERVLNLDSVSSMDIIKDEFSCEIPNDPYISPYFAKDEILKQLPPIKVLTVELDPCLDDCVSFSKKLKMLGNDVHLDVLKGLCHGFLNFSLFSKEANEGSKQCVKRIQELLRLESLLEENEN